MRIKSSIITDFGNFELDTNAIGMCSLSREDVILPYAGPLPRRMSGALDVCISFNIQPTHAPAVVLDTGVTGRKSRYLLSASQEELVELLDRFFSQTYGYGMDDFFYGQWRGLYVAWREAVTSPKCLIPLLLSFPDGDKKYIKDHIFECI